ncbi:MAG: Fe-S cluster assembly ATPase SufC [bacterium]|nr:Fe-S cluster assembly ATPase SufC [bacterium]
MPNNVPMRVGPLSSPTLVHRKLLEVKNLSVSVGGKQVLENVTFDVAEGEVVGLLGPNGSGKTSLGLTLMGHPRYQVTAGKINLVGKNLLAMKPEERAKAGLFMSFQNPMEIQGVPFGKFLFTAYKEVKNPAISAKDFIALLREKCQFLGVVQSFVERSVNEGFSGGEKKRAEILQLAVLEPKLAILDETDSGLDVTATKIVAKAIKKVSENNPKMSIILITHYDKFLKQLKPNRILKIEKGMVTTK